MDSDEFEQIPWSGLVDQAKPPVDPKWYLAGGVIGAIVIILLALRMFSGLSTPDVAPIIALDPPVELTMPDALVAPVIDPGGGAVTEADLMAIDEPIAGENDTNVLRLVSEWFVTDYFTRDGSAATIKSLERVMGDEAMAAKLPHHLDGEAETFVEWARAFAFEYSTENLVKVSVAFRTVHRSDDGFIRDPVRAVVVGVEDWDSSPLIAGEPLEIDLP
jgi:hypothetical protein